MSPKELSKIGRLLFGNDWQSPLARKLKVHRITVWRWLTKKQPIPEDAARKIAAMREKAVKALQKIDL